MSSVPYIFAGDTGNIPLAQLDANFANVKASVDSATVAVNVTASAQPNITSVGTMISVSSTGNVKANILIGNTISTTSFTSSVISVSGNVTAGNVLGGANVNATTHTGTTVSVTGNITAGNVLGGANVNATTHTGTTVSVTGNIRGGNLITTGQVNNGGLEVVSVNYANITANAQTTSLSTTVSTNILIANNTGYTHTINMPSSPVDGQITRFTISGNTVTLVVGTGTVSPTFAGSTTAGTGYKYVYRNSNTTWYRSI